MKKKNVIIEISIIVLILLLDMLTKFLLDGKDITLISGVFNFVSAHNDGAGFSLFSGRVSELVIITALFLIAFTIFHFSTRKENTILGSVAFGLIFAGALGNLIDRIFFGYVRDFLYFELIDFPIFNVADSCLTIGVILFAINVLFFIKTKPSKKKTSEEQITNDK